MKKKLLLFGAHAAALLGVAALTYFNAGGKVAGGVAIMQLISALLKPPVAVTAAAPKP